MSSRDVSVDETRDIVLLACRHWIQPERVDRGTRTWLCPLCDLTQPAASTDEAGVPAVIGSWDYAEEAGCHDEPVYVQPVGPTRPIEPSANLALHVARNALSNAEQRCRYHGQNWDRAGREHGDHGPPRCDSCKQPWRVSQALAAIARALGDSDE